jgi:hypothetical protein
MSISPTTVGQALISPPLDILKEYEVTPGFSVAGHHDFIGQQGFGLIVRFDPIPIHFGYRIGAVNLYDLPLCNIAFLHFDRIYAVIDVHYGDYLLWPLPQGPLLATPSSDLAVQFTPGVYGRIWRLDF